jgi:molybdopterin-guanine dinucleotide biosynthesis protein A
MTSTLAAGILAGGASSRMGADKALLPFRGEPLVARQARLLAPLFGEIVVAGGDPDRVAPFGLRVVSDRLAERCTLTGLHALLAGTSADHVFAVACDMPFLNVALVRRLLGRRAEADVVIPESDRGLEPLHAVYARSCLPAMEAAARSGRWKATAFHADVRVEAVRIRDADWAVEGRSPFLNANTPEEWRAVGP